MIIVMHFANIELRDTRISMLIVVLIYLERGVNESYVFWSFLYLEWIFRDI